MVISRFINVKRWKLFMFLIFFILIYNIFAQKNSHGERYLKQAQSEVGKGHYSTANSLYHNAIDELKREKNNTLLLKAYIGRAQLYLNEKWEDKDYHKALENSQNALKINKEDLDALKINGICLFLLKEYQQAEIVLKKVVPKLAPKDSTNLYLARIYESENKFCEAIKLLSNFAEKEITDELLKIKEKLFEKEIEPNIVIFKEHVETKDYFKAGRLLEQIIETVKDCGLIVEKEKGFNNIREYIKLKLDKDPKNNDLRKFLTILTPDIKKEITHLYFDAKYYYDNGDLLKTIRLLTPLKDEEYEGVTELRRKAQTEFDRISGNYEIQRMRRKDKLDSLLHQAPENIDYLEQLLQIAEEEGKSIEERNGIKRFFSGLKAYKREEWEHAIDNFQNIPEGHQYKGEVKSILETVYINIIALLSDSLEKELGNFFLKTKLENLLIQVKEDPKVMDYYFDAIKAYKMKDFSECHDLLTNAESKASKYFLPQNRFSKYLSLDLKQAENKVTKDTTSNNLIKYIWILALSDSNEQAIKLLKKLAERDSSLLALDENKFKFGPTAKLEHYIKYAKLYLKAGALPEYLSHQLEKNEDEDLRKEVNLLLGINTARIFQKASGEEREKFKIKGRDYFKEFLALNYFKPYRPIKNDDYVLSGKKDASAFFLIGEAYKDFLPEKKNIVDSLYYWAMNSCEEAIKLKNYVFPQPVFLMKELRDQHYLLPHSIALRHLEIFIITVFIIIILLYIRLRKEHKIREKYEYCWDYFDTYLEKNIYNNNTLTNINDIKAELENVLRLEYKRDTITLSDLETLLKGLGNIVIANPPLPGSKTKINIKIFKHQIVKAFSPILAIKNISLKLNPIRKRKNLLHISLEPMVDKIFGNFDKIHANEKFKYFKYIVSIHGGDVILRRCSYLCYIFKRKINIISSKIMFLILDNKQGAKYEIYNEKKDNESIDGGHDCSSFYFSKHDTNQSIDNKEPITYRSFIQNIIRYFKRVDIVRFVVPLPKEKKIKI